MMSIQKEIKVASDVMNKAEKTAEAMVKKAWSLLDAASEKKPPGDYLSQNAIRSIRGKSEG